MGKDVLIEVPCAEMELKAKKPSVNSEEVTLHLVPVPAEALAEVQEVLKKYQPQLDKFAELLTQVAKTQK